MNEFLEQFVEECRELVEQGTRELLALENSPGQRPALDGAFRAFHTLKGCAGIVDFDAMSRCVHVAEEALSAIRQGNATLTSVMIGNCLNAADQVAQWLDEIEQSGELPRAPDAAADRVIARFETSVTSAKQLPPTAPAEARLTGTMRLILEEQVLLLAQHDEVGRMGRVTSAGRAAANVMKSASLPAEALEIERAVEIYSTRNDVEPLSAALMRALGTDAISPPAKPAPPPRSEPAARSFRVDPARVDALVALTGELIVAKNAIAHLATAADESGNVLAPKLNDAHRRLDQLIGRLKEAALNLRVASLHAMFERFQRIVRELAIELSKPTQLVIEGEDTEADRAIVESLFEPLLHIVRNALDHGVEPSALRATVGKPAVATLRLSARREGEHVVIEAEDDGGGIDVARVRALAAQRGLVDHATVEAAGEQDVFDFIFLPGFSTRDRVSDLSGRGVGMDAVRASVERMGGSVSVTSEAGRGTRFQLLLPFSLMVTKMITVETAGQTYGLPLEVVVDTLKVPRETLRSIGSIEAFVWRNGAVPLVDLAELLGTRSTRDAKAFALAVVVCVAGQYTALEVDKLGADMEVILKPIDGLLAGTGGIAGATILGDGQVLLVLDVRDLLA